ncbi:MAG TPA: hypothetical protein VL549_00045 [Gemmatimonadales bacterium]|jgi:hypothetical protein|nr:hypothetical protein [Gemmatimonadales bacterium]
MATTGSIPQGDLGRLLETERRLGERLRAARVESERLVAEAQGTAADRERAVASDLALAEQRLAETLELERRRGEREIAAAAERAAAAFEQISDDRIAAVAKALALRFFTASTQ